MATACFKSLERSWQQKWTLNLIEDGSVTSKDWDVLREAFPDAIFHKKSEVKGRIEQSLSRHPLCLAFYRGNVAAPKVLEGPFLNTGEFHFCDPDLLFFRRMERFWPETPGLLFLSENHTGFSGFSHNVFHWAFRHRIPMAENINSGVIRLPAGFVDLDQVEWFLNRAHKPRTPFVIEQTIWSFLVANRPHRRIAPGEILCTKGVLPNKDVPPAIHFLANQKAHFWDFARETERYLKRDPVPELQTVPGRRIPWSRITAHVASGFRRRLTAVFDTKKSKS